MITHRSLLDRCTPPYFLGIIFKNQIGFLYKGLRTQQQQNPEGQRIVDELVNNYDSYTSFIVEGGDTTQYKDKNNNIRERDIDGVTKARGETREIFVYEHKGTGIPNSNAGAGEVWIVAHGWNPGFTDFLEIANHVKTAKPAATVLVIDWMQAAETEDTKPGFDAFSPNYKAVTWIGAIAQEFSEKLQQDFPPSSINFIGHSFGTFVSSQTGHLLGRVNTITALDPASQSLTFGYDLYPNIPDRQEPIPYNIAANYSIAYVGSRSAAGNQQLAATAHESFQMDFGVGIREPASEHGWVVKTAKTFIDPNHDRKLAKNPFSTEEEKPNLFTLDDNQFHPQFAQNVPGLTGSDYVHQGVMVVDSEDEVQFLVTAKTDLTGTLVFGTNQDDDLLIRSSNTSLMLLKSSGNTNTRNDTYYADEGDDRVLSGSGNDTLYGGEGNDSLDGSFGNDIVYGEEGNDSLDGSFGNDLLYGEEGNDSLNGFGGDDTLSGGEGDDTLDGSFGNDVLYGGTGNDTLKGFVGDDTLFGGKGNDSLDGSFGNDIVYGEEGNDSLSGFGGDDKLYGGEGNDSLDGGGGNDTINGGKGDDSLYGGGGNDIVYGEEGNDYLDGSLGNDTINGGKGDDSLYGGGGNDIVYGEEGNDFLSGFDGDDTLYGGEGNDSLSGFYGDDTLYGGEGNDTLDGGKKIVGEISNGNYVIRNEKDIAVFSDKFENYEYSISKNPDPLIGDTITFAHTKGTQKDGIDTLKDMEFAQFAGAKPVPLPLEDGSEDSNEINILGGNGDSIYASLGSSIYMLDGDADYKINLSSSQQNFQYNIAYIIDVSGSMGGTPLQEAKSAYTSLTNSLINIGVADVSQFMVIPFESSASQSGLIDATQANSTIQGLSAGGGTDFQPALTTAYNFFSGLPDGGTNIAYFLSDGQSSNGFESAASLLQSVADVQAYGVGGGVDTGQLKKVDSDGNISVLQDPSELTAEFNSSDFSADSIAKIDLLLDGVFVETIQSSDLIEDALGLSFEGSIDDLDVSFGAENLLTAEIFFTDGTPTSTVDFTIASGLEEATGDDNPFDEIVNGTSGDDTIRLGSIDLGSNSGGGNDKVVGNDLDNIINSGSGNDIVFGNDGNDTITTGSGQDRIDGGEGIDTVVYTKLFTSTSVQKVGNVITVDNTDTLTNVEFIQFSDVRISTNSLQPIPFLTTSDITIAEGNSSNTNAQFTFNLSLAPTEDVQFTYSTQDMTAVAGEDYIAETGQVTIAAGETTATVEVEIVADNISESEELFVLNLSDVSGAYFENDEQEYSVIATVEKDILEGSDGDDSLQGGDSDDTIFGKNGNDTLIGGAGADTLDGGNGNDTYFVDNAFDTIVENMSTGNDTVYSEVDFSIAEFGRVENLILTDNAIYGIGNSRNNVITGNSSDNILSGDEGKDTLDGGLGNDTLIGGTENDTYIIDSLEDTIIENESEGFDLVEASIDYSIENIAHVEDITLTGTATSATGNSLDNYLVGNELDNVLNGGEGEDNLYGQEGNDILYGGADDDYIRGDEGNDTLDGGSGNDTLRGGTGSDTYIVDSILDNIIEDANSGNDTVEALINYSIVNLSNIEDLTLIGDAISGTGNSRYNEITGNALDNTLDGGSGNDTLDGDAGDDSLIGGTGRDVLFGGTGNDTLEGGEGKDTLDGGADNNTLIGGTEDDTYIVDSVNNIIVENSSEGFDIVEASVDYSIDGFANVEHLKLTGNAVAGTGNSLDNYVDGNALDNLLNGQEGDDDIWGLLGNDILNGGTGDDTLTGHEGDDTLVGGMGDDELIGSAGTDIFVFNNTNEGIDEITDFSVIDDTIHVSATGFGGGLTAGDTILENQILIGSSSTANNATQRFIYKTNTGALYFDADGNQTGFDAVQIARLDNEPTISASDIFVTV